MIFNKKIEEKFSVYPEAVQNIAFFALENAKKMSAEHLAQLLESKVKQLARKEVNK